MHVDAERSLLAESSAELHLLQLGSIVRSLQSDGQQSADSCRQSTKHSEGFLSETTSCAQHGAMRLQQLEAQWKDDVR